MQNWNWKAKKVLDVDHTIVCRRRLSVGRLGTVSHGTGFVAKRQGTAILSSSRLIWFPDVNQLGCNWHLGLIQWLGAMPDNFSGGLSCSIRGRLPPSPVRSVTATLTTPFTQRAWSEDGGIRCSTRTGQKTPPFLRMLCHQTRKTYLYHFLSLQAAIQAQPTP